MNQFSCEVAIVGGGLSGCAAASELARAGVDVALFEAGQLPRHRVCGEFLSPESRATLSRIGVVDDIEAAGARDVKLARFCCQNQSADFDLGDASGLAISRFTLDPILFEAAKNAGARAFLGAKTRFLQTESEKGDGFRFEVNGQSWRARAVILAAGRAQSPRAEPTNRVESTNNGRAPQKMEAKNKARFCGLKAHFSGVDLGVGTVEMHLFRGGYCGLVRVEGEATNACLMTDYARLQKTSPAAFWDELLAQNPQLRARFTSATRLTPWCSTGNVSFEKFRPVGTSKPQNKSTQDEIARGILCAGDAAGYIHPLTGDGMAMALRAGELAATCARLQMRGLDAGEAARLYQAAWEREFTPRLKLAAQLHPLALRPEWARPVLPWLRCFPALRRALVRGTRGSEN
ncbi:NAD(P)/FAD-dependent oxidoreductase [Abditibacterium utsteinense]|uniref:NAD(P)/FAD-dependent oxidoreductase n=1 Tax=Abditibacterium utsteinense TaxID=1960156 RepID=UPI001474827F|nr:NAD(P)/FAD-dependent oxidoreductase [Abditibacterium utsteinense]